MAQSSVNSEASLRPMGMVQEPPSSNRSSMLRASEVSDIGGPPLQPSEDVHPRGSSRGVRRALDTNNRPPPETGQAGSPAQSFASPTGLHPAPGSGRDAPAKASRLTARALIRGSIRDSGSDISSKVTKDVYRDDRGRRVDRPKTVKADVHVIGEVVGASGFPCTMPALFCRYRMVYDGFKSWAVTRGLESGCTQVSSTCDPDTGMIAWEHPLDIQMTTQKMEAWPSIVFMVFARDDVARKDTFVSYALCPLPNTSGAHHLTLRTWYPVEFQKASSRNTLTMFLGIAPRVDDDVVDQGFVSSVHAREESGAQIASIGSGCIHLRLQMLFRHFTPLCRQAHDGLYKSLENFQLNLEEGRKREMHRLAAMEEHQANKGGMSEGLKQVMEGRAARFEAAQRALDRRSVTSSQDGSGPVNARSRSVEGRSSDLRSALLKEPLNRGGAQSAPRTRPGADTAGAAPQQTSAASGAQGLDSRGGAPAAVGQSSSSVDLSSRQAAREQRRGV